MNLRDLRYLVALADERHFGKAAERCFVSQPTLSAQIRKLEEYLGVPLVERQPKRVALTATGVKIVQRARLLRQEADAIVELAEGVFIFEFKLEGTPADALAQIRRQGYAEPYLGGLKPVYLIGVRFDLAQRTIAGWEMARN